MTDLAFVFFSSPLAPSRGKPRSRVTSTAMLCTHPYSSVVLHWGSTRSITSTHARWTRASVRGTSATVRSWQLTPGSASGPGTWCTTGERPRTARTSPHTLTRCATTSGIRPSSLATRATASQTKQVNQSSHNKRNGGHLQRRMWIYAITRQPGCPKNKSQPRVQCNLTD